MHRLSLLPLVAAVTLAATAAPAAIAYPPTPKGTVVETIFGTPVADPYRWLENDVRTDPKVAAWVAAENATTQAYLATLPRRTAIAARLKALWDYERFGVPLQRGSRSFYTRNSGLQNQAVLYAQDAGAEPRVLLDPNGWSKDGATALAEWMPSHDGALLAYAVQDGGSDWRTVKLLDAATGKPLADKLDWVKFSNLAFSQDGKGLYYSRFDAPAKGAEFQSTNLDQKVFYHRLGTAQSADTLVYATPDRPQYGHLASVTDDGRWLVITSSQGTDPRYEISVSDLKAKKPRVRTIIHGLENRWSVAGSVGRTLYLVTDRDAARGRMVTIDAARAGEAVSIPLVPEGKGTIDTATVVGKTLVVATLEDAKSVIRRYTLDGKPLAPLALPGIGSAEGFDGGGSFGGSPISTTFFSFTSYNVPTTIYRYDAATNVSAVFRQPKTPFDPAEYVVSQIFYTSKDGTRVPMFITHKRGLDLTGGAPTLLYAYGGFNIPETPVFSTARLAWMEMGGVLAVANIRSGGEYGQAWHDGGRRFNKQNGFDDFIAAAETLVKNGTTTPAKLAVQGGSNGGLLIGAVVNQRPDLFAAALPAVGVMDMLRFSQFTAGRYWTDDYGDPADEKAFRYLQTYSPYHNIRGPKPYPAILVTTADTDDRVVPGHSFKYTAALQAAAIGDKPHLIRIETRAGHGSGKPTDKIIAEYADLWAFAAHFTGMRE